MVGQIHMALIEVDNLIFTYPQAPRPALDKVSLSVKAGEFVLLCGPAGSGKTTLLRLLKREISPHGKKTGRTLYGGQPLEEVPTKPVSYTHLDVYKRQVLRCASALNREVRGEADAVPPL